MVLTVKYDEAKENYLFVDVRSPLEHSYDTIPGSINIPLLDDEERKIVGTAYKQINKHEARRLGVEIVSPKMPQIYEKISALKREHGQIVAFCAKGGYRSTYFASVFSSIGVMVSQLEGGYKGYRKIVTESIPIFNEKFKYIVIHGNTGVGKTDILYSLKKLGYSILDLEGAANHRGSLLGSIGIGACNSQKLFETNLCHQLDIEPSPYIFVEAESKKIGKVVIPECIDQKMKNGMHIFVDADMDYRVNSLKKDYILNDNWIEDSIAALERLKKYIPKEKIDKLRSEIKVGNFDYAARELMENYYDPMYSFKSDTYEYAMKFKAVMNSDDIAQDIRKWIKTDFEMQAFQQ